MYRQKIVTVTSVPGFAGDDRVQIAKNSVQICEALGLTGRVYAKGESALSIIEGLPDMVEKYVDALKADSRLSGFIEHSSRAIKTPEFNDYVIALDGQDEANAIEGIHNLTSDFIKASLPASPSVAVRMMIGAHIDPVV